jgi:Protein kinase domain
VSDQSKDVESANPRVVAALRDYFERIDRGEVIDRDKFISWHAQIADELRSFIAAEIAVREIASGGRRHEASQISTGSFGRQNQETLVPRDGAQHAGASCGRAISGQFGRYEIVSVLGEGAMGTVYLAEDTQLGRQVALKTPSFKDDSSQDSLERFYREARTAATLRHPNICPVHDVGEIGNTHYISMAYIEGGPLSDLIKPERKQTERQIVRVVRKLAQALREAHDHGIEADPQGPSIGTQHIARGGGFSDVPGSRYHYYGKDLFRRPDWGFPIVRDIDEPKK